MAAPGFGPPGFGSPGFGPPGFGPPVQMNSPVQMGSPPGFNGEVVSSQASSQGYGPPQTVAAAAASSEIGPAAPSDPRAGAACVVPMWNTEEFLCEEHVDVEDEDIYEDVKGVKRKRLNDGRDCSIQCPHARWWQLPSQEILVCRDGRWRDDTGRPAKELVCDTSNMFWFGSLGLVVLAGFLCTPGGRKSFQKAIARAAPASATEPVSDAADQKEGQKDQEVSKDTTSSSPDETTAEAEPPVEAKEREALGKAEDAPAAPAEPKGPDAEPKADAS